MSRSPQAVAEHYKKRALDDVILAALKAAGKDIEHLTPDDLAPVDEFHSGGRNTTVRLAQLAQINGSERVLDVGCGIGGPSRFLASKFGCKVTGLDFTAEFVALAAMLAQRTRLVDVHAMQTRAAEASPLSTSPPQPGQHAVTDQVPLELGHHFLGTGQDQVVETLALEASEQLFAHVPKVPLDVVLDVTLVASLGPAALVVPARDVVEDSGLLSDPAHPRHEDPGLLPVDQHRAEGLVGLDERLERQHVGMVAQGGPVRDRPGDQNLFP